MMELWPPTHTVEGFVFFVLPLIWFVFLLWGLRFVSRPRGGGAPSPLPPDSVTRSAYSDGESKGESLGDYLGMERYEEEMPGCDEDEADVTEVI